VKGWPALGLAGLLACGAAPGPREALDEATLWGAIAAPDQALTFARRGRELLLVESVAAGQVEASRLAGAEDPIELLGRTDAAAVRRLAAGGGRVSVPIAELGLPVELGGVHVAAGTNFREHGEEVGIEEPFLFPKVVQPTPFASEVPAAARLDYEVELCFVALRPLASERTRALRSALATTSPTAGRW
jgi:2-keto-4-pentenoate hydratase/2-oxohepta-3-ene-1,7-dioic acid hydratase in catechol pathway